jgi:cation transport ATPase
MFIGLFLGICLTIAILFVKLYKNITLFSFKTLAFGVDFFLIFFYSIYFFHPHVAVKLFEGKLQYLLDIAIGVLAILIYGLVILSINDSFPKISSMLNLFIALVGTSIAVPFAIGLLSPIIQIFITGFTFNGDIVLSQNHMLSLFLKYLLFGIVALPVWRYRMSKLEEI